VCCGPGIFNLLELIELICLLFVGLGSAFVLELFTV
jgi:hypothetical protein